MFRFFLLSTAAALLLGCQASNPYQAEGLPLPPAPSEAATHFDRSAYPAPVRSTDHKYWCWHNQAENPANQSYPQDSAQSILAEQLEQYGLRAATPQQPCQLKVQLSSQNNQRQRPVYYDYPYPSASFGYGYGGRHSYHDRYRHSGIGLTVPLTPRAYTEYYQLLHVSFTDAHSGQLIWQNQSTVTSNQQGQISAQTLRSAMSKMLNSYR